MTRKELPRERAIEVLEYVKHVGNGESAYKHDAQEISINMGIEAIKQMDALDKIRAEIEAYQSDAFYHDNVMMSKEMVLGIIDKYRKEQNNMKKTIASAYQIKVTEEFPPDDDDALEEDIFFDAPDEHTATDFADDFQETFDHILKEDSGYEQFSDYSWGDKVEETLSIVLKKHPSVTHINPKQYQVIGG